jgi:glycosyltransferase involved in cell wall biosynthesis
MRIALRLADYDRRVIGIALLTLVPGVVGGSETYARELLRALAANEDGDYRVLLPPAAADAGGGLPTTVASGYGAGGRLVSMTRAAIDPRCARLLDGAAAVHYPLTVPVPRARVPHTLTLHDVQHLDLPQLFSRSERAYRAVAYDRAVRRADRVIVVSEFVKRRAVERLGLDPDRVRVTPHGLDHGIFRPGDAPREPFLLYPARPWPHKNHARLFEAFTQVRSARPELRLVLTGGGSFGPVPDGVVVRGHLPQTEVVGLMQRAAALVFPSLYEGFGLPPLEAMACGCPVACSDSAALPEVVGDAARLFDPHDPEAIAAAILDVLDDPAPWVERGFARAGQFSWDETARLTEAVYGELASTRS